MTTNEIAVTNRSRLPDLEVAAMANAVNRQVQRDILPVWGGAFPDVWVEFDASREAGDWLIEIVDETTVAGAAGWHSIDETGRPYSEVSLHGNVSQTLSHEVIEMIADPGVNRSAENWANGLHYALEIADPVQASTYTVGDFVVSDFVTPAWFGFEPGQAAHRTQIGPFEIAQGGYAIRWNRYGQDRSTGASAIPLHERSKFRCDGLT